MYLPGHFSVEDQGRIREIIHNYGFATVISMPAGEGPYINHLPLVVDPQSSDKLVLIGHMAKRNPQWRHFQKNTQAMVLFQGPHSYVTPTWYKSGRDVPTWNYAVVHVHGKVQLLESFSEQVEVLKLLTDKYESPRETPWEFELPSDLEDPTALTSAIISFRLEVEKIEAKFKLSQNRPALDIQGVLEGLATQKDDMSQALRKLMLENPKS